MFEKLGPAMVRCIIGDAYDPTCTYELETSDAGLSLHITNAQGETSTVKLGDTEQESHHFDPLYSVDRIDAIDVNRKARRRGLTGVFFVSAVTTAVCVGLALLILYLKRCQV